ncbi:MAG: MaoC family dehydratase N-terminal domain-containing protein [Serpentinimonas sp.]|nr:MaoC family dehydratase N-terminal domain-containing protein [Serpentinimonas sp.]
MTALPPTHEAVDMAELCQWEGRTECLEEIIGATPLSGMAALMDRSDVVPEVGTMVPPLWHWLYFLPQPPQSQIGEDGHPRRGGFLPPVPLPRRMWAGGRLTWNTINPLRVGDRARRTSRIVSVRHKAGRSGELVFVEVEHQFHNSQGLCLTEAQDIVYRAAPLPGLPEPAPVAVTASMPWQRVCVPDPVALFRYSALTFNGHRIHYDRSYATGVEGYPGLVVHGPYIATLLLDLLNRHSPLAQLATFSFRAVRPTFDLHPFRVLGLPSPEGREIELTACDHDGWQTMQAHACLT